ncbi:hypothetical protein JCM5350_005681, partial [Sporobolomyces pararoseus]
MSANLDTAAQQQQTGASKRARGHSAM